MKNSVLFLFVSFISLHLFSQQNPGSLKWNEINSEHAKIIFPAGLENQAQKTANLIDYLYPLETKTVKGKPKKLRFQRICRLKTLAFGMVCYAFAICR